MTRSPGRIAHIGPSAPVITISPALNGVPNCRMRRASQTAALSGLPMHARPSPLEAGASLIVISMAHPAKSKPSARIAGVPSTKRALDALSAMVSTREIFQSDPAVDDFDGRQHEGDGAQYIRDMGFVHVQIAAQHQRDLGLCLRLQQALGGRVAPSPTIMSDSKAP